MGKKSKGKQKDQDKPAAEDAVPSLVQQFPSVPEQIRLTPRTDTINVYPVTGASKQDFATGSHSADTWGAGTVQGMSYLPFITYVTLAK
jgi:hypothetical protein